MDLDLRQLLPLVIIGGSFAFTGTILYGAWLLGRYKGREDRAPAELAEVQERLQRLEHVVDHAANAIERLEAAHQITARMLSESPDASRSRQRPTTPH